MTDGDKAVVRETIDSYIDLERTQIEGYLQKAAEAHMRGDVDDYDYYHGLCTKHRYGISLLKMVKVTLKV